MMADKAKLEETVLKLWRTPSFSGSYSGLLGLQTSLKLEKNISVSMKTLREIMSKNPMYLQHIQNRHKFDRRNYSDVYGYGSVFSCDVGKIYIYLFIIILIYFEIFKLAYMNPVSETPEGSESSQNGVEVGEAGINKYFLGK